MNKVTDESVIKFGRNRENLKHVTRGESLLYRPKDDGHLELTSIEMNDCMLDDPAEAVASLFEEARQSVMYAKAMVTKSQDGRIMIWCLTQRDLHEDQNDEGEDSSSDRLGDTKAFTNKLLDGLSSICVPNVSHMEFVCGTDIVFGKGDVMYLDVVHLKKKSDQDVMVHNLKSAHILMRNTVGDSVGFVSCYDAPRGAYSVLYCSESAEAWEAHINSPLYSETQKRMGVVRSNPQSLVKCDILKSMIRVVKAPILPGTPSAKKVPAGLNLDFGGLSTANTTPTSSPKTPVSPVVMESSTVGLNITEPGLLENEDFVSSRYAAIMAQEKAVTGGDRSLLDFAHDSQKFGCYQAEVDGVKGVMFCDWVNGAEEVFLRGCFTEWEDVKMELDESLGPYCFRLFLPENGKYKVKEDSRYQIKYRIEDKFYDRIPAYARYVKLEEDANFYNASVVLQDYSHQHRTGRLDTPASDFVPFVYEAHIGVSGREEQIGSYKTFTTEVLPKVVKGGYNIVCLMGLTSHPTYSTFGWHPTNYYAPTSTFGDLESLHQLINTCHYFNVRVIVSVVHSHAGPVKGVGLDSYGSGDDDYLQVGGLSSICTAFDAKKFNYSKKEVLRYLLGSLVQWATVFKVDGFRLEHGTSLLYRHQGNCVDVHSLSPAEHLGANADAQGHVYLGMFAKLCKELGVLSFISTPSSMPGLVTSLNEGGLGFDYQMSSACCDLIERFVVTDMDEHLRVSDLGNAVSKLCSKNVINSLTDWDSSLIAKRPLKIAMFSWESLHTIAVGGVAPHVTELSAGLSRLGHEVHVFTRSTTAAASHHVHYGVHYHECPMDLNKDFVTEIGNMCNSLSHSMANTEAFMNDHFAICHAHDWLAAKCIGPAKGMGRTTVLTMHSTEYGRCGNNVYAGKSVQVRDIEKFACMEADRVITVSGVSADELKGQYHVHPEKIRVVYNGINVENWDDEIDVGAVKQSYGITPMQPTLVFVGRMTIQKGPDLLVDAMGEVVAHRGDTCFVMVGDGYLLGDLRRKTECAGLSNNVKWLGSKSGQELKNIFKMADAVIVPSRNEPFGIVVLEAWACKKPVVATTCGGPRDFVTDNVEGFLVDPTPGSVAYGCKRILDNFDHAQWMGERGRVKAAYSFTWDIVATQTRDVYQELTNHHDAPYGLRPLHVKHGEQTLIHKLIGPNIFTEMGVMSDSISATRGIMLYNLLKLYVAAVSQGGRLSWMGSEFGHPTMLDLPRPGNNFSQARSYTRWDLLEQSSLKFKHMALYDSALLSVARLYTFERETRTQFADDSSLLLVLDKGNDVTIVLNFHPTETYDNMKLGRKTSDLIKSQWTSGAIKYGACLDTTAQYSDVRSEHYESGEYSYCFEVHGILPRTGYVFSSKVPVLKPGNPLLIESADDYLESIM